MSIPDEKERRRVLWVAGCLIGALVVLGFILGYLTGSSGDTPPIIIQNNSGEKEILSPR